MCASPSACRDPALITNAADDIRAALPIHDMSQSRYLRPAPQDWIVVSTAGSDDPLVGHGTAKRPYRTIGLALSKLQGPGQGVLIHPGTYPESGLVTPISGTAARPIWVKGLVNDPVRTLIEGADVVRIMGSGVATGACADPPGPGRPVDVLTVDKSFWILDGFEIAVGGGCYRALSIGSPTGPVTEAVGVNDLEMHGVSGPQAVRVINARDVVISNCRIHDNWWAPGGAVKDCHGINVLQQTDRILIRDNVLRGHSGDSIQVAHTTEPHDPDPAAPDADVPRNVTIDGNDMSGDFENAIDVKSCRNVTMTGNRLHDYLPVPQPAVGFAPIVIHYDARGVLIEQNDVSRCGRAVSIGDLGNPANPARQLGPVVLSNNQFSVIRAIVGVAGTGFGVVVDQAAGVRATGQQLPHANEIYDNAFTAVDRSAVVIGGNGVAPRVEKPLVVNNLFDGAAVCITINPAAISERDVGDPNCQGNALRSGLTSDHNEFTNLQPTPFRRLGDPITFAEWTACYDKNSCTAP